MFQLSSTPDFVVLHAVLTNDDFSNAAAATIGALRMVSVPDGVRVLVGGENAANADTNTAVADGIPWMTAVMIIATLAVLLGAFRSVVLPCKAVVMAGISVAATLGILTWIFQDGHRAATLGVTAAALPATSVTMVVAMIFGLSTDYEVFLMSRMIEAHRAGADTAQSVRQGMAATGRVITAAASLLVIVTGAAALSQMSLMKIAGFGMAVAIVLDATVVRMLLVPAVVVLMGRANWWFPALGPLVIRRNGIDCQGIRS
ncbi:MMPL family transporter [Nocardia sp. NPDC052566]|uniref:MMPL family transporter n=1 Tax=Nocardia sp. NPDC052566 TaxID=3364330 RepID=UPI0037CB46F8